MLFVVTAAAAQPATEIYLFDLSAKKESVSVSNPVNITQHKGYDNQPYFHPENPQIFYASFNDDGRSDIKMYDYKKKATVSITNTPEREYSPTVTPDQGYISCIIQRDNNAQDLGKYPIDGGQPDVIIEHLTVGYHVWADNSHLALFVLGTPNTLHYLRLPTKEDTVLAENIGRSLHRMPAKTAISFVHKISDKDWVIRSFDTTTRTITELGPALTGREDLCWLPDGRILMSDGTQLFYRSPNDTGWKKVEFKSPTPLKEITRLAVSSNGKKLAVVASEE